MGVTGLWKVVEHCARPTKIETLNKKRLAVDASIWIYQFLKAVRDKEGNALRNSHVVGFFRRICKLLFIGALPVFVFDGGAPALKRQTIIARKSRREGRREDAAQTASKLLAREMQRLAEEEEQKRKDAAQQRLDRNRDEEEEEEVLPQNLVYADELNMTEQEVQQSRRFKKTDQYHLPDLSTSIAEMGGPDDPRVMSLQELENYARQFDSGEDINVYDFSKIDFDSPFFVSLPASDRYNILNAARLRSRLRMGHSKEQLDAMFPDRMAFSKFQIERVRERNELTQRLMNINGMNEGGIFGVNGSERIAGEKGREYVLVKNDGVEGGWALGVVSNKDEGRETQPIDIEKEERKQRAIDDEDDDDDDMDNDFEDVPIEGLNRLPKLAQGDGQTMHVQQTRTRRRGPNADKRRPRQPILARAESGGDSLFVRDENEDAPLSGGSDTDVFGSDEDQQQLDHAIAMSLETGPDLSDDETDRNAMLNTFQQKRAEEARPLPRAGGKATAHVLNLRAGKSAPKSTKPVSDNDHDGDDSDQDMDMDITQALAASSKKSQQAKVTTKTFSKPTNKPPASKAKNAAGFEGPLPFEKLDLGSSLLGKKKAQEIKAKEEGGFEKAADKKKDAQPLPPWFAGNLNEGMQAQRKIEQSDRKQAKEFEDAQKFEFQQPSTLRRDDTELVIDLEAEVASRNDARIEIVDEEPAEELFNPRLAEDTPVEVEKMGDVADAIRAVPPSVISPARATQSPISIEPESAPAQIDVPGSGSLLDSHSSPAGAMQAPVTDTIQAEPAAEESDEPIEWSDSDHEGKALERRQDASASNAAPAHNSDQTIVQSAEQPVTTKSRSGSPDADFEDVDMNAAPEPVGAITTQGQDSHSKTVSPDAQQRSHTSGLANQNTIVPDEEEENFGFYTDSEDERLMIDLADEATEHARFGAQLSATKTQTQIQSEYENEMKQLRSQQKKDRRDADEVTQIMIQECQQLLRLFGLPYITAPMEAEAQCAELVRLGLVDGIVTDDSDCFLFGGTRIYKNMFNQAKLVECYLAPDLEKEYALSRQKLIDIAQLLGSDYSEGLSGVGHVKALEILSEFATLTDFRDWWTGVQTTQHTHVKPSEAHTAEPTAFRRKFRKQHINKLFLAPGFPDPRVAAAYLEPEVDSDPSPFQWGVPDLSALRAFLSATIGWTAERTDEVLVPVIRDMNRREAEGTQSNITAFMKGSVGVGGYAPRQRLEAGSKRAGSALDRLSKRAKAKTKT